MPTCSTEFSHSWEDTRDECERPVMKAIVCSVRYSTMPEGLLDDYKEVLTMAKKGKGGKGKGKC